MFAPLALVVTLAAPVSDSGLWMSTAGRAGERALNALGAGGDGALYATGGGAVYRLEPGAEWRRIGRTAPRLRWDANGEVDARGTFPQALLAGVEADATAVLDFATGEDGEVRVAPERIAEALRDHVEQESADVDSPFGVAAVVSAGAGAWLATGGGLYFADRSGVTGPVPEISGPVRAVLPQGDVAWVGTSRGIYRAQSGGQTTLLRQGNVTGLAQGDGFVALVFDGKLLVGSSVETASPMPGPKGDPLRVAGDAGALYLSTRLAVHRRSAGQWRLCAGLTGEAKRLVPTEGNLIAVTEDAVWLFTDECQRVVRVGPPWPGGFEFTDVVSVGGMTWAASNEGAFLLGPMDADTSLAVQMEGYERAVRAIPPVDRLVVRAIAAHELDANSRDFGFRPLLRNVLPDLTGHVHSLWARRERADFMTGLKTIDLVNPRFDWQVWFSWSVALDRVSVMAAAERDAALEAMRTEESIVLPGTEGEFDPTAEGAELVDVDAANMVLDDDDATLMVLDGEAAADVEDRIAEDISRERRATIVERRKLVAQVQRLYQQRQNLLYRLWVLRSKDLQQRVSLMLSVAETEERLRAMTGGAFRVASQTVNASSANKESMQ
jgi:hypothetical protein